MADPQWTSNPAQAWAQGNQNVNPITGVPYGSATLNPIPGNVYDTGSGRDYVTPGPLGAYGRQKTGEAGTPAEVNYTLTPQQVLGLVNLHPDHPMARRITQHLTQHITPPDHLGEALTGAVLKLERMGQ